MEIVYSIIMKNSLINSFWSLLVSICKFRINIDLDSYDVLDYVV